MIILANRFILIVMNHLPQRITFMVRELHQRGYTDIYLYAGMSSSGLHWRYEIGQLNENTEYLHQWPVRKPLVKGSIQSEGEIIWCKNNASLNKLTDDFIAHFESKLIYSDQATAYSMWYDKVLDGLESNELLNFYADYGGQHQQLLEAAPGFCRKRN